MNNNNHNTPNTPNMSNTPPDGCNTRYPQNYAHQLNYNPRNPTNNPLISHNQHTQHNSNNDTTDLYSSLIEASSNLMHNIQNIRNIQATIPSTTLNTNFLQHILQNLHNWNRTMEHYQYSNSPLHAFTTPSQPDYYRQHYLHNTPVAASSVPFTNPFTNTSNQHTPFPHNGYANAPSIPHSPPTYAQVQYTQPQQLPNVPTNSTGESIANAQNFTNYRYGQRTQHPQNTPSIENTANHNSTNSNVLPNSNTLQNSTGLPTVISNLLNQLNTSSDSTTTIVEEFEDANGSRLIIQQFGGPGNLPLPNMFRSGNIGIATILEGFFGHDNNEDVPVPLPIEILQKIPVDVIKELKNNGNHNSDQGCNELCGICQEDYKINDTIRILPCMHNFHAECVDRWFQQNVTCPICRADLRDITE